MIYQIQDIKSIRYSAVDIRELTVSEIRQCSKLPLLVLRKSKRRLLDQSSPLHQNNVMGISLSLTKYCVLRITTKLLRLEKFSEIKAFLTTSLSNSDLFAVIEELLSFRLAVGDLGARLLLNRSFGSIFTFCFPV